MSELAWTAGQHSSNHLGVLQGTSEKVLPKRNSGRGLVYEQQFALEVEREELGTEWIIMRPHTLSEGLRKWMRLAWPSWILTPPLIIWEQGSVYADPWPFLHLQAELAAPLLHFHLLSGLLCKKSSVLMLITFTIGGLQENDITWKTNWDSNPRCLMPNLCLFHDV